MGLLCYTLINVGFLGVVLFLAGTRREVVLLKNND